MEPAGHRILVKPDSEEQETEGGIIITKRRTAVDTGVIVAIGPTAWKAYRLVDDMGRNVNGRPWAKVGDYIAFATNAGRIIRHPETHEIYRVMNDEDVRVVYKTVEVDSQEEQE